MQRILTQGNRAVVINVDGWRVWANLYVNARDGIEHADITKTSWTGRSMASAERWAAKQLAD